MGAFRHANNTVSAHGAVEVTPSDATVIPVTRALYIGVAGNLAVRMADGQTITYVSVANGVFPIQVDMVLEATAATDIVALY